MFFGADSKLRSGWRFLIFLLITLFVSSLVNALFLLAKDFLPAAFKENRYAANAFSGLIGFGIVLVVSLFCGKYLEAIPFSALGTNFNGKWFLDLALGLLYGIAAISLAMLISVATGGITIAWNTNASAAAITNTLIGTFCIFVAGSLFEEILSRGYMLQTFVRSNLAVFGVLFTSSLFAAGHLGNPHATFISTLNTLLAGIVLAYGYLSTKALWFPYGFHFAWNWFQGPVYGAEVSGLGELVPAPLMVETDLGPNWLTGGDYGFEGGLVCTIALGLSFIAIYFLIARKRNEGAQLSEI